jgi:hypothetical protein
VVSSNRQSSPAFAGDAQTVRAPLASTVLITPSLSPPDRSYPESGWETFWKKIPGPLDTGAFTVEADIVVKSVARELGPGGSDQVRTPLCKRWE